MAIPLSNSCTRSKETRLFSASAPEINPVEWFQVKSKKERSLEKKIQKQQKEDTSVKLSQKKKSTRTTIAATATLVKFEKEELDSTVLHKEDTREELDFMFDEEKTSSKAGVSNNLNYDSSEQFQKIY